MIMRVIWTTICCITAVLALTIGAGARAGAELGQPPVATNFCQAGSLGESSDTSVTLGLSRRSVPLGGVIRSRVENRAAEDVAYGPGLTLQRLQGGRWLSLRRSTPSFQPLIVLHTGMSSACQSVHIPPTLQAGRFRLRQFVSAISSPSRQVPLFGYFKVEPVQQNR
jgi:hypothetical protein